MSEEEAQLLASVVADYLAKQRYRVAQELTGDESRMVLVGTRGGERAMVDVQLSPDQIGEEAARRILGRLSPLLDKVCTKEAFVAVTPGATADYAARALIEGRGLRLLAVDPRSATVSELQAA